MLQPVEFGPGDSGNSHPSYSNLPTLNYASDHESMYRERSYPCAGSPRTLWSYHAPITHGRMNGPLKAEARHQLGDTIWWRRDYVLQDAVYPLRQWWCCPNSWVQAPREWREASLAARSHGPLSKCLFPFSATLNQIPSGFEQPDRGTSVIMCNWSTTGVLTESAALREGSEHVFFVCF